LSYIPVPVDYMNRLCRLSTERKGRSSTFVIRASNLEG